MRWKALGCMLLALPFMLATGCAEESQVKANDDFNREIDGKQSECNRAGKVYDYVGSVCSAYFLAAFPCDAANIRSQFKGNAKFALLETWMATVLEDGFALNQCGSTRDQAKDIIVVATKRGTEPDGRAYLDSRRFASGDTAGQQPSLKLLAEPRPPNSK